ncbi:MAG TPA: V-type ATPase subunit [Patescibacteria group bacterium]|nr:V-type ATPase subunit [Patescibacteria group bacterium]
MALRQMIADSLRYGFAVGRVRVLETRLLPRAIYERLIEARSLPEQRRILGETIYGGYLETAHTIEGIERGLDAALSDLYEGFLRRSNLPGPFVEFFLVRHEFENLKGRLKAEALGVSPAAMLTSLGGTPVEVYEGPSDKLPTRIRHAERRIRESLARDDGTLPPDEIEDAVDTELFRALEEIAGASRSAFVLDLFRLEADIGNARAFVRARARDIPVAEIRARFVPGGKVPITAFVSAYRLPLIEAAARLSATRLLPRLDLEAVADPARFDFEASRIVSRRVRASRMTAIGPEPVLGYIRERLAEVAALRVLLMGSLAGVPAANLRERLLDVA